MSDRITKAAASVIADRMIDATYKPLKIKHQKLGDALIERALRFYYTPAEYEKFLALHDRFHTHSSELGLRTANGYNITLYGNEKHVLVRPGWLLVKDTKLCADATAWAHEKSRLFDERKTTKAKLEATIHAHVSYRRLRAEFPEAAEHIGNLSIVVPSTALVVPRNQLLETLAAADTPKPSAADGAGAAV